MFLFCQSLAPLVAHVEVGRVVHLREVLISSFIGLLGQQCFANLGIAAWTASVGL